MKPLSILLLLLILLGCSDDPLSTNKKSALIDNAALLGNREKLIDDFLTYNQKMLEDFDIDFRVLTTKGDEDINLFTNTVFNQLQKKSRSHSGKAILLVINSSQDKQSLFREFEQILAVM